MTTKSTIYSGCNPQLLTLFETAGHPNKVLCVALDYAKAQHMALICNGVGDLLKSAFALDNTAQGAAQLLKEVRVCARQRKIRPEHVFFGGEDSPPFAENFLRKLRQERFLVVRVNAWEAKQQRDNFQASSDRLDLLGIARCCLKRRGEAIRDLPEAYPNLRIATRDRDKLVRMRTGGVVPRTKQTGGPGKEPNVGRVQQRCNKPLKNVVLQAVEKVIQHGPEELRRAAAGLRARSAHTEFAMAKRLLRLAKCVALSGTVYRPRSLLDCQTPKETLAAYYQEVWEKLLAKWRGKADLNDVFAPAQPLGQWRQMVKECYGLELALPQQKARHKTRTVAT